ncbi:hypothetical protein WME90_29955 [Sorangium sp. So ce375]|uniref:hypothetical protein n=1 Tax=Sorangium sp. So ce375 TaxID=3133306 RepID=UPI003F5B4141
MTSSDPTAASRPLEAHSRAVQRALSVGLHDSPRRIDISVLEQILSQLRSTVEAVAADLGVSDRDVGGVDLVDFTSGSCRLTFEQVAADAADAPHMPLAVAIDSAKRHLTGKPFPPMLTDSAKKAVMALLSRCAELSTPERPIAFVERNTVYSLDPRAPVSELEELIEVKPRQIASQPPPEQTSPEPPNKTEEPLPAPEEWLLTFTGRLRRLDARERKMWVDTSRGTAVAPLSAALFAAADADRSRWQIVSVVALGKKPEVKDIVDVLHVTPADDGAPEFSAMPMNEAAKGLTGIIERIDSFGKLKRNWNTHDGLPTSAAARRHARGFLLLAASAARARDTAFVLPFATPLPSGNVQLEWEVGPVYLELEFSDSSAIGHLRMHGSETAEGAVSRERALELVAWFHDGVAS